MTVMMMIISSLMTLTLADGKDTSVLCPSIQSDIEPGYTFLEDELTTDRAERALVFLEETAPEWLNNQVSSRQQDKALPVISGETAIGYYNSLSILRGYILKMEAITSPADERETARKKLCGFLSETVRMD